MGGVQELQHTDEVGAVGLEKTQKGQKLKKKKKPENTAGFYLNTEINHLPFSFPSWSIAQGLFLKASSPAAREQLGFKLKHLKHKETSKTAASFYFDCHRR